MLLVARFVRLLWAAAVGFGAFGSPLIAVRCRELPDSGLARVYGVIFAHENVNCMWFSFFYFCSRCVRGVAVLWVCFWSSYGVGLLARVGLFL